MHWVDRGPEPEALDSIRSQYTPRWVEHFRYGTAPRPSDSRWGEFRADLSRIFSNLCAYCEELCRGEVEHFRPRSRFPEKVYEWRNWLLACHDCNHAKGKQWPSGGYIDPCARSRPARPENFFEFDVLTGEIITKAGLNSARRMKATHMIDDLRLNEIQHRQKRLTRIAIIDMILSQKPAVIDLFNVRLHEYSDRSNELSSVSRCALAQLGYSTSLDII